MEITIHGVFDGDSDGEFSTPVDECDDELFWDVDDSQEFTNKANYFVNDVAPFSSKAFQKKELTKLKNWSRKSGGERYHCPIKDEKLLEQLLTAVNDHLSSESMHQVCYGFDTNINENLNHIVVTFAQKHQYLSTTFNLHTRVYIAVGTQILGHYPYWSRTLSGYSIEINLSLSTLLRTKDKNREDRSWHAARVRQSWREQRRYEA